MAEGNETSDTATAERERGPVKQQRRPITTVDVPISPATSNLFDGLRKGRFTERQRHSLASDTVVGPLYRNVMVSEAISSHGSRLPRHPLVEKVASSIFFGRFRNVCLFNNSVCSCRMTRVSRWAYHLVPDMDNRLHLSLRDPII